VRKAAKYILILAGIALIVFIRGYMLIETPHLTEAEAFTRYWPLWLLGGGAAISGAWL